MDVFQYKVDQNETSKLQIKTAFLNLSIYFFFLVSYYIINITVEKKTGRNTIGETLKLTETDSHFVASCSSETFSKLDLH